MSLQPSLLKIERAHSIEDIEGYSRQLDGPAPTLDLMLPTNIKNAHLGAIGSLIQLITTWSQRCPAGNLLIYSNEPEKIVPALSNLALSQHGLVALLGASTVKPNQRDSSVDCTEPARRLSLNKLDDMSRTHLGLRDGSELLLLAADDTIYASPPQLYSSPGIGHPSVHPYTDFLDLATEMIDALIGVHGRSMPLSDVLIRHVTTLIYELFKNTHMWARHHVDNVPIRRSIRGIRVEFSRYEDLDISALSCWHRAYLKAISPEELPKDFVELAVFDSGPGLAARMIGKGLSSEDSLESEYEAVMQCLSLHATTSKKSHHGAGLAEVMSAISDANGFIRVRSGRMALYRDFSSTEKAFHNDFYLHDWKSGGNTITAHSSVVGTLISVLLPVDRKTARHV